MSLPTEELLAQGIASLKAGAKPKARELLSEVVKREPGNETAWLWLGAAVSTPRETLLCLKRVLAINPQNTKAQAGIRWATAQIERERSRARPQTPSPPLMAEHPSAQIEIAPSHPQSAEQPPAASVPATVAPSAFASSPPMMAQSGNFFVNLAIAILSLALILGFLIIAALLYAWLG